MTQEDYVALYLRVSSEQQAEGYSLEAQEAVLRQEAHKRGKLVYQVYLDAGVSGVREDRKGLNRLLKDARRGCFGTVLVWTVSRLSRKLSYLLKTADELKKLDIGLFSLNEQFDITTAMGQFSLTMLGAVAQMQRESWMESSRIGMQKRIQAGRWGGGMMLGYRMVPDAEDPRGGGKLAVVPEEAETVRQIFSLYAQGLGYKAVVNRLHAEGRTGRTGRPFSSDRVAAILRNAIYVGKVRFNTDYYAGIHEPIISLALWDRVQAQLVTRSKPVSRTCGHEYLLSGVLRCPVCGSPMLPARVKSKRADGSYRVNYYYNCSAYQNQGKAVCKANSVRAIEAENKVLTWLSDLLSSPFWFKCVLQVIEERLAARGGPEEHSRKAIEASLADIARKQADLLRRYEDDLVGREAFLKAMQAYARVKEEGQRKLAALEPEEEPAPTWSVQDLKKAFRSFRAILDKAPAERQRQVIRALIGAVRVNSQRQVAGLELILPVGDVSAGASVPFYVAV
jgi:site-specific DNA recombinase